MSNILDAAKKAAAINTDSLKEAIVSSVSPLTFQPPRIEMPRNYSLADYSYEVIMERIKEFEDELDDQHEVAVKLASFGQSITMSVTDIGYSNPSTLVFYGLVGDQKSVLIQHMSQLNFLLLSVQKADPEKPPRRIGFETPSED